MAKTEIINDINKILKKHGNTTIGELELDCSPCYSHVGEMSALVEGFRQKYVEVVVYVDGNEVAEDWIDYELLSSDLLDEIYEIIVDYEIEQEKTEKRCED